MLFCFSFILQGRLSSTFWKGNKWPLQPMTSCSTRPKEHPVMIVIHRSLFLNSRTMKIETTCPHAHLASKSLFFQKIQTSGHCIHTESRSKSFVLLQSR
jgi:hypothetical protein